MKTIKSSSFEIWGNDPISANKRRFIEPNISSCSTNCGLDGEDGHVQCTGSSSH